MQRKSLYQDIRKIREDMTQPEIIYEDEAILVCHKPAGVATQTKRLGQKDMESILKNYIVGKKRVEGSTQPPYIGIVHRLDQPVEGVMVYAKTPQAAAKPQCSRELTHARAAVLAWSLLYIFRVVLYTFWLMALLALVAAACLASSVSAAATAAFISA